MEAEFQKKLCAEFDRQVDNLLQKGYPQLANKSTEAFIQQIAPLKEKVSELFTTEPPAKRIPFVIVIKRDLVSAESVMPLIKIKGKQGYVDMNPAGPADFVPIAGLEIPTSLAYLLVDIDTGQETLNVTPHDALKQFQAANRLPLMIDEGVSLVAQFPEVLADKQRYNCFSMLGSRREDQRVPALWISYKKPRLGWCWDNNPHTWLGSASCGGRVGV
jgi:hypothetical protein